MELRPIERSDIGSAGAITGRGFATPPKTTWAAIFDRLANLQGKHLTGPIGYILRKDDADVGIILTLRSPRSNAHEHAGNVVNLSGWYIDEPYRWYAPMMLKKILREKDTVFTDLTASVEVSKMLPALKFKEWADGVLTTTLPQSLAQYRRGVAIVAYDKIEPGKIDAAQLALLQDHAQMGCISCVMTIDGTHHPLIFITRYRRNIPHAYLIYAGNREVVLSALGNITFHLLRHGKFLLALDCNEDEAPRAGSFRRTTWHKYFSGTEKHRGIDYAYSEFVYLNCS